MLRSKQHAFQHHKGCSWSKLKKLGRQMKVKKFSFAEFEVATLGLDSFRSPCTSGSPKDRNKRGYHLYEFQFSPEIWSEHPFSTHFNTISQGLSDLSKTSFSKWPSRKPKKVPLHISLQTHFTMKLNPRLCSGPPFEEQLSCLPSGHPRH